MKTVIALLLTFVLIPEICLGVSVKAVAHNRSSFDPAKGENVRIDYVIDEAAYVELAIFDGRDLLIKKISTKHIEQAGQHAFDWDGRDNAGRLVPPEAYHYTLTAYTQSGKKIEYDPTDQTGGEAVTVKDIEWNKEHRTIQFTLMDDARVSARVGISEQGPMLRTLLNWAPRLHGVHTIAWDGKDEVGVMDVSNHPRRAFSIKAFKLGINTIMVGPESESVTLIENITWPKVERVRKKQSKPLSYSYSQLGIETRGDFPIIVTLPSNLPRANDGAVILTGRTAIHMDIPEAERHRVLNQRFETSIYLDGKFLQETEMGTIPMTWYWDPKDVQPGTYYLTANITSYHGNFGTSTVKLIYRPEP